MALLRLTMVPWRLTTALRRIMEKTKIGKNKYYVIIVTGSCLDSVRGQRVLGQRANSMVFHSLEKRNIPWIVYIHKET